MTVDLTSAEFRQLLDMVYIGNWGLNSARGDDRITEYDRIESKIFGLCSGTPLSALVEKRLGISFPSRAFEDGGIHEAIAYYEDAVFFDILAEELARRDLGYPDSGMYNELNEVWRNSTPTAWKTSRSTGSTEYGTGKRIALRRSFLSFGTRFRTALPRPHRPPDLSLRGACEFAEACL